MFSQVRSLFSIADRRNQAVPPPLRTRLILTLGNLLFFAGMYILLYVGGVQSQIAYQRLAARGDNDLAARPIVIAAPPADTAAGTEPAVFSVPIINGAEPAGAALPDTAQADRQASTVSRLVIPSIDVDAKVVEVGWRIEDVGGRPTAIWDVAEFAVGQHRGSANPGQGDNIVLAGHVGGYGKVFRDLYYVQPGDRLIAYSEGQQYLYVVAERLVVDEEGVSPEQRAANARYIAPTGQEVVTLVTCWPAAGPDRFAQRVIVRAVPFGAEAQSATSDAPTSWNLR
jgi:LPXTG-site transpeptidase (sortase) family protein